mmetsp:Transcript_93052/g.249073  ORF Transcript_93052/g.249073 Transcript_93052/m.249073 type:complete len:232 (+) Transcript_93052:1222-1917(+)
MANNSSERVCLISWYSLTLSSQSCPSWSRYPSSAAKDFSVSSLSSFICTMETARSPCFCVFSSMAVVAAAISLFLAEVMLLKLLTASLSWASRSARSFSIVSFICFRMPTIWPEAGTYPVPPCRNADTWSFSAFVNSTELDTSRSTSPPVRVCSKAPDMPLEIEAIALPIASMFDLNSALDSAYSFASLLRMSVESSMFFCASARSALAWASSDKVTLRSFSEAVMLDPSC